MKRFFIRVLTLSTILVISGVGVGKSNLVAAAYKDLQKGVYPIVCDGILLGGSQNGKWITSTEMGKKLNGGEKYQLYSWAGCLGIGIGSKVTLAEVSGTECVEINNIPQNSINEVIATSSLWDGMPRKAREQDKMNSNYTKLVADILTQNGLKNIPAVIKQSLRIDLDGDGTEEVIVNASNLNYDKLSWSSKKGMYSFVLLRKIIKGKVQNIILSGNFYSKDDNFSCPSAFNILPLVDLNGDGVIDIVIENKYYEGHGYSVYDGANIDPKPVLSNSLGA